MSIIHYLFQFNLILLLHYIVTLDRGRFLTHMPYRNRPVRGQTVIMSTAGGQQTDGPPARVHSSLTESETN